MIDQVLHLQNLILSCRVILFHHVEQSLNNARASNNHVYQLFHHQMIIIITPIVFLSVDKFTIMCAKSFH